MTMREILFRGKRVDNGEWAKGYYIEAHYHWHNHGVHKEWIVSAACANGGWFTIYGRYPVVADTVGQYTGLTDKNGKKIFEGDVVKRCFTLTRGPNKESRETQVGVVRYDNVTCGYLIRGACNLRRQWPGDTIEVIGNIHDNPELLEDESHG